MAQLQLSMQIRRPLRFKLTFFLLRLWVWAGSYFPDGLIEVTVNPDVLSRRMQYRVGRRGPWRPMAD